MLVTWIRHICPGVRCDRREERKEATRMRTDQGQWASSGLPLPAFSFQLFTCGRGGGGRHSLGERVRSISTRSLHDV